LFHLGSEPQFERLDPKDFDTFGFPYDFESITHLSALTFSKNGRITMKTNDPAKQKIIGKNQLPSAMVKFKFISYLK